MNNTLLLKNISKKNMLRINLIFVFLFLIFQVLFWLKTEQIKPNLGIIPEVPTLSTIKAFSFGDEEFYFRFKGLRIQNAGDTFGRFSPLKDYDYNKLSKWFYLLDSLDSKSNYIPSLAAYYYSLTQNHDDVIYIINYLNSHADRDPENKWWWYYQATYLANNIYNDKDLAIKMAKKLKKYSPDSAPIWTKQMLAILLSDKGKNCEAIKIISGILDEYEKPDKQKSISDNEINFMKFFIEQRLNELKKNKNFNPASCL